MTQKLTVNEFNKYILKGKKNSYAAISPTAWTVAYRRTFSDIPYAQKIYDELEKTESKVMRQTYPMNISFWLWRPFLKHDTN